MTINTQKNNHVLKNRVRKRLFDAFTIIPKKQTFYLITIKKNCEEGCNCKDCIQKWVKEDRFYGKIEAYELNLPEGNSILFINKNKTENTKNDTRNSTVKTWTF